MYSALTKIEQQNYKRDIKPHLKQIIELRGKGAGVVQIAEALGIHFTTLYKYEKLVPELQEALNEGQKTLVINLENALWSKALGGLPIKKTTTTTYKTSGEEIVRVEEELSLPDNTAMIFALKSLEPNKYVEKQEIEIKGETQPSFREALLGKADEDNPK